MKEKLFEDLSQSRKYNKEKYWFVQIDRDLMSLVKEYCKKHDNNGRRLISQIVRDFLKKHQRDK